MIPPKRDQRGLVLVWMAIVLTALIAVAAIAVDLSWRGHFGRRVQNAADAAATAGVVKATGVGAADCGPVRDEVRRVAKAHGYDADNPGVIVSDDCETRTDRNQLKVTIRDSTGAFFSQVAGVNRYTVERASTAEYLPPLELGQPGNAFGIQPGFDTYNPTTGRVTGSGVWTSVGGYAMSKANGDAFQMGGRTNPQSCLPQYRSQQPFSTDNCPQPGPNAEYDPQGYFFKITANRDGPLAIYVFDPAPIDIGYDSNACAGNLLNAPQFSGTSPPSIGPFDADALGLRDPYLYAPGYQRGFCTNDQAPSTSDAGTTFVVRRAASATAVLDSTTPIASPDCVADFAPRPYTDPDVLARALTPGTPEFTSDRHESSATLDYMSGYTAHVFRKWVRLCTVPAQAGDTFALQATSRFTKEAFLSPTFDPSRTTSDESNSSNRFALRAVMNGNPNDTTGATLSAYKRLQVSQFRTSTTSNDAQFDFARVPSAARGKPLVLRLWDPGDGGSLATLRILAPPDSSLAGQTLACRQSGPPQINDVATDCSFQTDADGVNPAGVPAYSSHWVELTIQLPNGYSCDETDPRGCWWGIRYEWGANAPSDNTTWMAFLRGSPIRLIQ